MPPAPGQPQLPVPLHQNGLRTRPYCTTTWAIEGLSSALSQELGWSAPFKGGQPSACTFAETVPLGTEVTRQLVSRTLGEVRRALFLSWAPATTALQVSHTVIPPGGVRITLTASRSTSLSVNFSSFFAHRARATNAAMLDLLKTALAPPELSSNRTQLAAVNARSPPSARGRGPLLQHRPELVELRPGGNGGAVLESNQRMRTLLAEQEGDMSTQTGVRGGGACTRTSCTRYSRAWPGRSAAVALAPPCRPRRELGVAPAAKLRACPRGNWAATAIERVGLRLEQASNGHELAPLPAGYGLVDQGSQAQTPVPAARRNSPRGKRTCNRRVCRSQSRAPATATGLMPSR